jgi:hypothetical protein
MILFQIVNRDDHLTSSSSDEDILEDMDQDEPFHFSNDGSGNDFQF